MSMGVELMCSIPRISVPRAEFSRSTWRKKPLVTACSLGPGRTPRGRDGFLACRMLGKIGLVSQQCRSRIAAKDGVEEWTGSGLPEVLHSDAVSPADGAKGVDDDKHFDAGNNGVGGGAGTGGWNAGGSNNGDGSVGDDKTNDGVPWWWWLLYTAGPGSNSSYINEPSGVTAAFGEGLFQLIVRDIVIELARGLVLLTMGLCTEPIGNAILVVLAGIMGLSIGFMGLVVSWLWMWISRPDGDEQKKEEAGDDDHEDATLQDVLNITSLVL